MIFNRRNATSDIENYTEAGISFHKTQNSSQNAAQHSVHPTGGSRRVFRQVAWLEAGSGKAA